MKESGNSTRREIKRRIELLCKAVNQTELLHDYKSTTSFATVNIPVIRTDVPYLFELPSRWSRTLLTKSELCIGADHIGPATYQKDLISSAGFIEDGTYMKGRITLWTSVAHRRTLPLSKHQVYLARLFRYLFYYFAKRLLVE